MHRSTVSESRVAAIESAISEHSFAFKSSGAVRARESARVRASSGVWVDGKFIVLYAKNKKGSGLGSLGDQNSVAIVAVTASRTTSACLSPFRVFSCSSVVAKYS